MHERVQQPRPTKALRSRTKRALDVTVSAVALVALALPMLAVALAIRLSMGRPILFVQERPGLGARPIRVRKFRTMAVPADGRRPTGEPDEDRLRVTPLGSRLRRLSLDELPQLFSVLSGDMSLVGPRPLLMEYVSRYDAQQARRHLVRPGVTGLAQVSGRTGLTWDETFALDVWYVDNWSLRLDLAILFRTAVQLIGRSRQAGEADLTREVFRPPDREGGPAGSGA